MKIQFLHDNSIFSFPTPKVFETGIFVTRFGVFRVFVYIFMFKNTSKRQIETFCSALQSPHVGLSNDVQTL